MNVVEQREGKVNIFIDEYCVNSKDDTEMIDQLSHKIDQRYFFWVTLGRVSFQESIYLQEWLEKKNGEFVIPNLKLSLRNSKEIVQFERSLEPEQIAEAKIKLDLEEFVRTITEEGKKDILKSMEFKSAQSNEIPKCGLPDQHWPKSNTLTPTNQPSGFSIPDPIVSSTPKALPDDIKNCFKKLDSPGRVLVIVLSKNIPKDLIQIIRKVRSKKPIVVDKKFNLKTSE